jgi:hypothetical protein
MISSLLSGSKEKGEELSTKHFGMKTGIVKSWKHRRKS